MPLRHAPGLALNLGDLLERRVDLEVADPYWRAVDRFVGLFDPVQDFILRPCRHRRLLPEQFTRAVEHLARRRVVVVSSARRFSFERMLCDSKTFRVWSAGTRSPQTARCAPIG